MPGLTEETTRAAGWLAAGQKWQLGDPRGYQDFRPNTDVRQLTRMLRGVPKELLEGVVAELVSHTTVHDPQVEGKVFEGDWLHGKVWWTRDEASDDHVLTLYQMISTGAGATLGKVVENGCAYVVTQTFYWDVASLPSVTQGSSGIEYVLGSVSRDPETGKYSCVLEKREQVTQSVALYVVEQGAAEVTSEQQFLGVRTGDKDESGASVGLQDMTLEAGKIKTRKRRKNRNCTQDIEEQSRLAIDQTATEWEKSAAETVTTVKATQGTAETEPSAPTAGTIVEVSQEPTPYGKARKAVRTRTAVDQPITEWEKSAAETVTTVKATQGTAETEPSAPTAGTIVEVSQEPTPYGKARKAVRTRTAVDQTITEWTKTHAEVATTVKATQGTAETAPAAPAAGTIVEVIQDPTPYGKARKAVRTRVAEVIADAGTSKTIEALLTRVVARKSGQASKETEPTSITPGTVVDVINTLRQEWGDWATEKVTETATYRTATFTVTGAGKTTTVVVHHNITEANLITALGNLNNNATNSVGQSLNRFLLWDAVTTSTLSAGGVSTGVKHWELTGKTYSTLEYRPWQGRMLKVITTYTCTLVYGSGIKHGQTDYSGAKEGSYFHSWESTDSYEYRKVTGISTVTTDVTSEWVGGTAITS